MKEKDLQDKCRRWAKERGCKVVKNHGSPFTETGLPDLFVFMPNGQFAAVEMKRPGEKATAIQAAQIADFKRLGFKAFVCDNFADFTQEIGDLLSVDKRQ